MKIHFLRAGDYILGLLAIGSLVCVVISQSRKIDALENQLWALRDRNTILEEQLHPGEAKGQPRNRWEAFKVHPATNQ